MSVDEVEPIEEEAADENAVATRGTHLASTQTVTHEYLTQSGKVMRETVKTDGTVTSVLDFVYDESGKPFAMIDQLSAQPKTYYYVLNLQGDVVKLVTESGAVAASYEYDAWGNILASSGSMAEKNPLRYRGYYYDSETGFYYLQSRYYDPAMHRFINADSYASTGQGFIGTNMFAYCHNSPVAFYDTEGNMATEATIAATNWWNPIGWIAGGILVVEVVVVVVTISEEIDSESAIKSHEISEKQANEEPTPTVSSSKKEKKKTKNKRGSRRSGKEKANDTISWVDPHDIDPNKTPQQNARRILDEKYGPGNWKTGPAGEFNKIVKWIERGIYYYIK